MKHVIHTRDVWVFDLDNTLYPRHCNLFEQIDAKMKTFISEFLAIDVEEAHKIQKLYFHKYGTTLRGLMENHSLLPEEYLSFVHDIDVTRIPPNVDLDNVLFRLPGRKVIFTNGTIKHAKNVLNRIGITHHFEDIFDIVAANYVPKPNRSTYEAFIKKFAIKPSRAIMLEDISQNLIPAHELGMTTVWIRPQQGETTTSVDKKYINYIIDDLVDWLKQQIP